MQLRDRLIKTGLESGEGERSLVAKHRVQSGVENKRTDARRESQT